MRCKYKDKTVNTLGENKPKEVNRYKSPETKIHKLTHLIYYKNPFHFKNEDQYE